MALITWGAAFVGTRMGSQRERRRGQWRGSDEQETWMRGFRKHFRFMGSRKPLLYHVLLPRDLPGRGRTREALEALVSISREWSHHGVSHSSG